MISSLAAALIGRLRSLWATLVGGLTVGLVQGLLTPYGSGHRVPRGDAVRALDHRPALALAHARRHDLADGAVARWTPRRHGARIGPRRPVRRLRIERGVRRPRRRDRGVPRGRHVRPAGRDGLGLGQDLHERRHLLGGRAGPRHPLRAGGDDLARADRPARDRHVDGDAAQLRLPPPVPGPAPPHRGDHLRGRGAGRIAGAAALGPLPGADHADVRRRGEHHPDGGQLPERRRRVHRPHGQHRHLGPRARPQACGRGRRHRLLPLRRHRLRPDVPARARAPRGQGRDAPGRRSARASRPRWPRA